MLLKIPHVRRIFQKIKNARQYYVNFTDFLSTSYLNITNNKTYKTLSAVP